jgi:hypothetical protein
MPRSRDNMTYRRVHLESSEAGEARVPGTIEERLKLTSQLSLAAWRNSGNPFPSYSRAEIPVRICRLGESRVRD